MTVKVRGPRDEAVEAEAACPRCHQMNRFVLPAEKKAVPVHLVNFTEYKAKCVGMRFNEGPIQPHLAFINVLRSVVRGLPTSSCIDDAYHDQFVTLWINFWFIETEPVVASEAAPFKPYPQQMPAHFEAFDTAHAPPLTPQSAPASPNVEIQAQSSLPQNMRIQSVQVGTLVPTLTGEFARVEQQSTAGQEMRTEEVQCGMCQQIIALRMPTMRGEPLRARATCPHCQQLNEFDIPALQSTSSLSTAGGFAQPPPATTASSAAPPMPYSPQSQATAQVPVGVPPQGSSGLTMASQAQYGLPATMQVQQTAVGVPAPELTGVQRALLVGINYYGSNCELSGCIPDVHNMKRLLVETYHWNPNDIKLLTDDGQNETPTRKKLSWPEAKLKIIMQMPHHIRARSS
ncbi:Ca(2+)-dependent cysteine protease [Perkinsus olseni]|uniref:Ca(2+)-dependent cysteine protease n=1 Tax=Perkinsus olseni TaxID=32597 RepID=A0A7J6NGE8_PEROL|nr:Ca(2+)-dependent cysteine protease [Perkinsus olseni]